MLVPFIDMFLPEKNKVDKDCDYVRQQNLELHKCYVDSHGRSLTVSCPAASPKHPEAGQDPHDQSY